MFSKTDVQIYCDTLLELTRSYEKFIKETKGQFKSPHLNAIDALIARLHKEVNLPFQTAKKELGSEVPLPRGKSSKVAQLHVVSNLPKRDQFGKFIRKHPQENNEASPEKPISQDHPGNPGEIVTTKMPNGNLKTEIKKPEMTVTFNKDAFNPHGGEQLDQLNEELRTIPKPAARVNVENIDKLSESIMDNFEALPTD